ncbi:MAG: Asparagine synthetase [glutamine-hydrolyzing] 1 [Anaerolineae bacterium]|nr:Asparagine synthetase [glutamine-hydrolyzing] 1 [Anaerolineae bacterium]
MCGIFGVVQSNNDINEHFFANALNTIAHRGPDDSGLKIWQDHKVGLGHRRLAIIDLSPAGRNPMTNEDGTIWITFNGEIYNYKELRSELESVGHRFKSNTDTEVIIHAYEEWGDNHIQRLRGMFAYALYDRRIKKDTSPARREMAFRLLLVRDRLGIKPLNYYWDGQTFLFSSETKAILAYPGTNHSIDRSAIFDYLTILYIPAPKTAYQHIRKLPSGHCLMFDSELGEFPQPKVQRYWEFNVGQEQRCTQAEAIETTRDHLLDSVRAHLVSDVPVGLFLSGGVDSSSILALTADIQSDQLFTFSIGFDVTAHSETNYARIMSTAIQTKHQEDILSQNSLKMVLPHVVWMYDEPFADSSAIPTYAVSRLAKKNVKVVLSGDGGDEVFAGYNWYGNWLRQQKLRAIPATIRELILGKMGNVWPQQVRGASLKQFLEDFTYSPFEQYARQLETFSPIEKRQLLKLNWAKEFADYDDYWFLRQYWRSDVDPITRVQYLDLKTFLVDDILTKVDRASMAVSLEVRPPLLDHNLVEFIFRIPSDLRTKNSEQKYLLKQAMKHSLPSEILNRKKKGFSSPLYKWIEKEFAWTQNQLTSGVLAKEGIIDPAYVKKLAPFYKGGKCHWGLLVLEQWFQANL